MTLFSYDLRHVSGTGNRTERTGTGKVKETESGSYEGDKTLLHRVLRGSGE